MVRLFVGHNVDDYAAWRKVCDEFDERRRPLGVTAMQQARVQGEAADLVRQRELTTVIARASDMSGR